MSIPNDPVTGKQAKDAEHEMPKPSFPYEKYITSIELILLRNNFYQDSYRALMKIFLVLTLLTGILIYAGIYEKKQVQQPVYFAINYDGSLLNLQRLREPNMNAAGVLEWASEAATQAYSFNFVNYRKALQDARAYFTREGYQKFLVALKASNNLTAVRNRKLVVTASLNGTAVVLQDSSTNPQLRAENGAYTWEVQIPMVLTYESAAEDRFVQNVVLRLLVTRVSMLESPKGLGIDSFVVREII